MTGDEPREPRPPIRTSVPDPVGEQLAGWGKVALLETAVEGAAAAHVVAVGFIEEPDGSLLVAGGTDATWARTLLERPACRVTIGERSFDALAEPLDRGDHARAIRELILRYGTPAERLGAGPSFRLHPVTPGGAARQAGS